MNDTTKYFPCKIYNNGNWWNHEPTFAILSMTPNFGIEQAIEQIKKVRPENIFIKEKNKDYFCTPINGLNKNGWDNCHWCLGGSKR